jgi:hypothetical protein
VGEIFPEYYILKVSRFGNRTRDKLDEWIYFFKNNKIEKKFNAKGLAQARIILDIDKLSPEEQEAYDARQRQRDDEINTFDTARDEGIEKGIEKGRKERNKIAKELKKEREERKKRESELKKEREERKKRESEFEKEREERKKRESEFEKEREALLAKIAKLKQDKRE